MFNIDDIIQATGGRLISGPALAAIEGVSIDSRKVQRGQIFIAVKGDVFDGHDFIADVLVQGVRVILVHKPVKVTDAKVSVIRVKDTIRSLGDLARFHRRRFTAPVIALTGSAGKTTTKEMVAAVLGSTYNVLKNEGTQNNHIGVPLTLLRLQPMHQMVALECGTNQPGDIPWLADVARPDVVVFTNVGESHLEKLKTPAGVLKEKWTLTTHMGHGKAVIVNADDEFLMRQAHKMRKGLVLKTYGINHKADVKSSKMSSKGGRQMRFVVAGKSFELGSCGINNVYNALATIACGLLFKVPMAAMASALKNFEFPCGRGQIVPLGKGWLINDAYNANPVSMRGALQTMDALSIKGKKIFVAADMLELGVKAKTLHRQIGAETAASSVDILITVGPLAQLMANEARLRDKAMQVFACKDVDGAQSILSRVLRNGDAVLVKGSRRMKMEQMVEFLLASPGG